MISAQVTKKIRARRLLDIPMDVLPTMITGEFYLITDDGMEILTDARKVLMSAFAWEYHRQFPKLPIHANHLVDHVLGDAMMNPGTHLDNIGQACFDTLDQYVVDGMAEMPDGRIVPEIELRDKLAKMSYEITNSIYNELSYYCEEYVTSFDITDAMKLLAHPRIRRANNELDADNGNTIVMQKQIDNAYTVIEDVLVRDEAYKNNPICQAVRTKTVKMQQIKQSLGPRGFLTDIDSNQFRRPIMRGYLRGLRSNHDLLVESRSAAKALAFTEKPLQDSEYFSRRLQLVSQIVRNLHIGDCGSKQFLHLHVKKGELKNLVGKYYELDDGALVPIRKEDKHLEGRTLKLRSVIYCQHDDPYGICSTCFGEAYVAVPDRSNLGHICCSRLGQEVSQIVMSTKHYDGSAVVEGVVIDAYHRQYLKASADNMSYMLSDAMKGKKLKMLLRPEQAPGLKDIMMIDVINKLHLSRVTEIDVFGLAVSGAMKNTAVVIGETVRLNVGQHKRQASLTYEFLYYVRSVGWEIDEFGNYVIDLAGWDVTKPMLTLPLKHYNMSDHSNAIADLLESSVEEMERRDKHIESSALLIDFHDLVNRKLSMSLAINEVVIYGTMIVSAENGDYRLPKPWTDSGFGVMKKTMMYRSLAPAMAYQNHRQTLTSPESYNVRIRPDHPMDGMIMPMEVFGRPGDTTDWADYLYFDGIANERKRTGWKLDPAIQHRHH